MTSKTEQWRERARDAAERAKSVYFHEIADGLRDLVEVHLEVIEAAIEAQAAAETARMDQQIIDLRKTLPPDFFKDDDAP